MSERPQSDDTTRGEIIRGSDVTIPAQLYGHDDLLHDVRALRDRVRNGWRMHAHKLPPVDWEPVFPLTIRFFPNSGQLVIDTSRMDVHEAASMLIELLEDDHDTIIWIMLDEQQQPVPIQYGISVAQTVRLIETLLSRPVASPSSRSPRAILIVNFDWPPPPRATDASTMPLTIYLADGSIHEQVEAAVDDWLASADLRVEERLEPVIGSWFRSMRVGLKQAVHSPAAREAALATAHAVESHAVLAQDAMVTATLLQNLGPVIQSLQPTKDAVLRVGALLIVKVDWSVQVFQLTAAQQMVLDHKPIFATSPQEIIAALQLSAAHRVETALAEEERSAEAE